MAEAAELGTTPEVLSLREELARNLSSVAEGEQTQGTPEPQEVAKPRDEQGRFVPEKQDGKPPSSTIQSASKQEEPNRPARPSSWKKDYWGDWDKLSAENPKLAAYLNEREGQFASGVSTYKKEWEQAKPLIDAVAPFMPVLQQNGIDPARWVSNLGNAHHRLVMAQPQEKIALLQKLAQDYNVPVQLAVQDQQGQWQLLNRQLQPPAPQFDPSMVQNLVRAELMQTSTKQALDSFTAEAPQKYPHFDVVRPTMAGLLQAGLADDLPSAYEAALRHPRHADLFAQLQEQQRAEATAQAKEAQRAKVNRARSAAVSAASATPGAANTAPAENSLRSEIAANLRAVVGGRV